MRPDSITLAIFEKYAPQDLAEVAAKMATAQSDLENVEAEKRVSDAAFNERIKKFAADVSALAKQYNKGGETAQIGCDIRYDHPEQGKKSYFRMDRNELVETHDMSWEEKQETIQFPLTAAAPEPSVSDLSTAELEKLNATPEATPEAKPAEPAKEEVTELCPYPNCIHFANHEGAHEFPKPEPPPRKSRKKATPPPPDAPPAPGVQP